jgi:hypothetical protein
MQPTPTSDHRLAARSRVLSLIEALTSQSSDALGPLVDECQALARAIEAFHMEGIRFRMYNVDRLLTRTDLPIPPLAQALFTDARHELEAAGFHTRSHQAPG